VAAAATEGPSSLPYAAAFVASLAAILWATWFWPRAGGVAAVVAAVAGALWVDHPATRRLLFAPALLLGIASLAYAPRREEAAR
jgi:hypothetical protein